MKIPFGNQRGISLIEILVVLVILLVGIMSAIRVFPTGFGLIQHSSDMTVASRLAQRELTTWINDPASLPNGVLPSLADYEMPDKENYNQFRDVIGESVVVPGEEDPTYVLRMGPVDSAMPIEVRTAALKQETFSLSGITPSYQKLLTPAEPTARDLQQYQIDESGMSLFFRPTGYNNDIIIDFEYMDGSGQRAQYRTGLTLSGFGNFPNDAPEVERVDIPTPAGFASLVSGSVKVYRLVKEGGTGGNNPFNYAVASPEFGVLKFHPGLAGIRVHVNYRVKDWRILHEDVVVEANATDPSVVDIRTSVPFIKDRLAGAPGNVVAALVTLGGGNPAAPMPPGLMQYIAPWGPKDQFRRDLRAGILKTSEIDPGTLVRVYYMCEGDWAMWLSKSFSLYELYTSAGKVPPGCYRFGSLTRKGNTGNEWELDLEFPLADVSNGVVADVQVLDSNGALIANLSGTYFTILDIRNDNGNAVGRCWLTLQNAVPGTPIVNISNVRGVTVKVKVGWKTGGRAKYREVETILNRP